MTRPHGDHLAFGPVEEAPNLLFQDLEMVQPFFQPVQSELSQEVIDLQQILDFTSSEVMDQQFNNFKQPTGRARNSSICSNGQPTGTYIYYRLCIKAILGFTAMEPYIPGHIARLLRPYRQQI